MMVVSSDGLARSGRYIEYYWAYNTHREPEKRAALFSTVTLLIRY